MKALQNSGLYIRFYVADKSAFKTLDQDLAIQVARIEQNTHYFAHFTREADDKLDLKEDPMPQIEVAELNKDIKQIDSEIAHITPDRVSRQLCRLTDAAAGTTLTSPTD